MICAAALLLSGTSAVSQAKTLTADQALDIVRTLNTAEVDSKLMGGHFLTLAELPSHRRVKKAAWSIAQTDETTGTLEDYRLVVNVAPDGKHYQLSMIPTATCGVALFSNESGVIYTGRGLGCSETPQ
jgi:hypothetical protein